MLYAALTCLALVVGTAAYASYSRPAADASLARSAVSALRAIEGAAGESFPASSGDGLSVALGDNAERVDLFLVSDSGLRHPSTRDHLEGALLLFTVADQVWAARDAGDDRPPAAEIAGFNSVAARFAAFQDLASADASGTVRLDNTEMRAVNLLLGAAQAEIAKAEASLAAQ